MEHIFGKMHRNGMMMESLKTVSEEHSAYSDFVEIKRSYDDCVIVDRFRIVEHYQTMETESLCYDWYTIDQHYRYIDTSGPVAAAAKNANEAASIAFVTLAEAGSIDDVTAGEHMDVFSPWASSVDYSAGNLRTYKGKLYRCISAHTSQEDWTPDVAVSLWTVTSDPAEEWPAWSQPVGATDAYAKNSKVTHNGTRWISSVDANVWEPGVYGWTEYTE